MLCRTINNILDTDEEKEYRGPAFPFIGQLGDRKLRLTGCCPDNARSRGKGSYLSFAAQAHTEHIRLKLWGDLWSVTQQILLFSPKQLAQKCLNLRNYDNGKNVVVKGNVWKWNIDICSSRCYYLESHLASTAPQASTCSSSKSTPQPSYMFVWATRVFAALWAAGLQCRSVKASKTKYKATVCGI